MQELEEISLTNVHQDLELLLVEFRQLCSTIDQTKARLEGKTTHTHMLVYWNGVDGLLVKSDPAFIVQRWSPLSTAMPRRPKS